MTDYDLNQDGIIDSSIVDIDGDGTNEFISDTNQDGEADAIGLDTNANGLPDWVVSDINADGLPEWTLDANENGRAELIDDGRHAYVDSNEDNQFKQYASIQDDPRFPSLFPDSGLGPAGPSTGSMTPAGPMLPESAYSSGPESTSGSNDFGLPESVYSSGPESTSGSNDFEPTNKTSDADRDGIPDYQDPSMYRPEDHDADGEPDGWDSNKRDDTIR